MTDAMLSLFDEGELPSLTYVQSTGTPAAPVLSVSAVPTMTIASSPTVASPVPTLKTAPSLTPATPATTARATALTPTAATPPPPLSFRPRTSHLQRIVADSTDRVAWLRARSQGITATDVAKLATPKSVQNAAYDKMHGTSFGGNSYTDHGRAREPEIAAWVRRNYGIEPSTALFRSESHSRHLATPDGVVLTPTGELELAEIKTTSKAWRSIPRSYLRQVWWQQYVLGAERTLVVWEQHTDFVPVSDEPECQWVDRDEDQIAILVGFANQLIDILDRQATKNAQYPPYDDYR